MKITILSETEHYANIDAILKPDGGIPTFAEMLPLLEQLRAEHGLRLCFIKDQGGNKAVFLCEKIGPANGCN